MDFINKKGVADMPYAAGFNGKEIRLYAKTLADAKQTAVEHFKPKKKQASLIWVVFLGEDIDPASL